MKRVSSPFPSTPISYVNMSIVLYKEKEKILYHPKKGKSNYVISLDEFNILICLNLSWNSWFFIIITHLCYFWDQNIQVLVHRFEQHNILGMKNTITCSIIQNMTLNMGGIDSITQWYNLLQWFSRVDFILISRIIWIYFLRRLGMK